MHQHEDGRSILNNNEAGISQKPRGELSPRPLVVPVLEGPRTPGYPVVLSQPSAMFLPLYDALNRRYPSDAHFVAYLDAQVPPRHPRINYVGLETLPDGIFMQLLVIDVDNPSSHRATGGSGGTEAPSLWRRSEQEKVAAVLERHPGGLSYDTRGGYRMLWEHERYPITTHADAVAWRGHYDRQLIYLAREYGIFADPACANANQLFRLPHATRDAGHGPEERDVLGSPHAVSLWTPPPMRLAEEDAAFLMEHEPWSKMLISRYVRRKSRPRQHASHHVATNVPPSTSRGTAVGMIALAEFLRGPLLEEIGEWHSLFLALVGTLAFWGLSQAQVEALVRELCHMVGDTKLEDRLSAVRTTFEKRRGGGFIAGFAKLDATWPTVAAVVATHVPLPLAATKFSEQLAAEFASKALPDASVDVSTAFATIESRIKRAAVVRGVDVIVAPPGVGKTEAAVTATLALASATNTPPQSVVVMTRDHAVARVVTAKLRSLGVPVERCFGVLAETTFDGTPLCKNATKATQLYRKGLSVPRLLCPRCEFRSECPVIGGVDRDPGARVYVGPSALAGKLLVEAGPSALVIVDESPHLVDIETLSNEDLQAPFGGGTRDMFSNDYAQLVAPLVSLMRLRQQEARSGTTQEQLEATFIQQASGPGSSTRFGSAQEMLDLARAAAREPAYSNQIQAILRQSNGVDHVATATRVLRCLTGLAKVVHRSRLSPSHQPKSLDVSLLSKPIRVLRAHQGGVVILDATADLPAIRGAFDVPISELRLEVDEKHVVVRMVLFSPHGSRARIQSGKTPERHVAQDLGRAGSWLHLWGVEKALIVSHKPVCEALKAAWSSYLTTGNPSPILVPLLENVSHALTLEFAYFGATRGHNKFGALTWDELDAVVTVGDPWTNGRSSTLEAACLGLDPDEHYRREAAAELEQVHGRLRPARRKSVAFSLHVGRVLPLGWHSKNSCLEPNDSADAVAVAEFEQLVARVSGLRELGRATATPVTTLRGYRNGTRTLRKDTFRELVARLDRKLKGGTS